VVPAALHEVIKDSFKKTMNRDDARAEARFLAFTIAIAISMLFIAPHIVWKFIGQKRATELVKRWEAEDARGRPPGSFVPVWSVKLAGYLSSYTVRPSATLSLFHTLICFTHLRSVSLSQPLTRLLQQSSIQLLTCPR
jgi:hypothetical protein